MEKLITDSQWARIGKFYGLAPREREVMRLICMGLPAIQVAGELGIKEGTVRTYVKNIYRSMGPPVNSSISMLNRVLSDAKRMAEN